MRVLITGASGFLGSECLKQFKDHDHEVITTDKTGKVDLTGDLSDAVFRRHGPAQRDDFAQRLTHRVRDAFEFR